MSKKPKKTETPAKTASTVEDHRLAFWLELIFRQRREEDRCVISLYTRVGNALDLLIYSHHLWPESEANPPNVEKIENILTQLAKNYATSCGEKSKFWVVVSSRGLNRPENSWPTEVDPQPIR